MFDTGWFDGPEHLGSPSYVRYITFVGEAWMLWAFSRSVLEEAWGWQLHKVANGTVEIPLSGGVCDYDKPPEFPTVQSAMDYAEKRSLTYLVCRDLPEDLRYYRRAGGEPLSDTGSEA